MALKRVKVEPNFGRIFLIAIAIFVILLIISMYFFQPSAIVPFLVQTTTSTTQPLPQQKFGTVLVAIKDSPKRVDVVGTLNELLITFSKVEVHFVGEDESANATGEWMTVFEGSKRVDLLTLTDINGILGEKTLPAGKYTQVRLTIDDVAFNVTNTLVNARNKRYPAIVVNASDVPSGELRFVRPFNVTEGKTSALIIDFNVERSATRTASGYTLKPVVQINVETLESGQQLANSVNV
ncbi:MAG TPA: DUF4382 domain-containing protein [archaeon]|nr:DUF4382 domain-containing protein [archaeon]